MKSDRERKTNAFVLRNLYSDLPYISISTELIQTGYFCDFAQSTVVLPEWTGHRNVWLVHTMEVYDLIVI